MIFCYQISKEEVSILFNLDERLIRTKNFGAFFGLLMIFFVH